MIDQDKPSLCEPPINVGIYGCTKAGKTRFLFQLLEGWKRQDRFLPQSDQALSFLAQVRAEIEKHGESMPTVETTEGISVRIRPAHAEPARQFVFRDLRGELLTDGIPPAVRLIATVSSPGKSLNAMPSFFSSTREVLTVPRTSIGTTSAS